MHMYLLRFKVLLFFLLLFLSKLSAQVKYEREVRLRPTEIPVRAFDFSDELSFEYAYRWYRNLNQADTTYEMRTRHLKTNYCVVFNSNGTVECVKKEISWKKIPRKSQDSISAFLSKTYRRHKVHRVQEQISGSNRDLIEALEGKGRSAIKSDYVLQIKANDGVSFKKIEFLFSADGSILGKTIINERDKANLEY